MEVQGIGNYVVIKRDVQSDRTEGGILLPESAKEKLRTGVVLSLGDEAADDFGLSPGDQVVFKTYEGLDIKIFDQQLLFLEAKFVVAKLKAPVKK